MFRTFESLLLKQSTFQVKRNRSGVRPTLGRREHDHLRRREPTIRLNLRRQVAQSLGVGHPRRHEGI